MSHILAFTPEERQVMVRPPDPSAVRMAENLLIAALYNYRQVTTGETDRLVSYLDVPAHAREVFFRAWAVPVAVEAIWRDEELGREPQ